MGPKALMHIVVYRIIWDVVALSRFFSLLYQRITSGRAPITNHPFPLCYPLGKTPMVYKQPCFHLLFDLSYII